MKALYEAFKNIRTWEYAPNESGDAFDKRICRELELHTGFFVYSGMKNYKGSPDAIIHQPNGSQKYPDILLISKGEKLCIEIKRSKTGSPVWNSGFPRTSGVYIFNGGPGTTFYLGLEVISTVEETKLTDNLLTMTTFKQSFNSGLGNSYIHLQHVRPMYQEREKKDRNPFLHPDRNKREQNVLNYLRSW